MAQVCVQEAFGQCPLTFGHPEVVKLLDKMFILPIEMF